MADGIRTIRRAPLLRVPLGSITFRGGPRAGQTSAVEFNSQSALNGHVTIVGGSGSGKTHQLRNFVAGLARGGCRVHLVDPHGDVIPDAPTDTIKFSEATEFGLNPLAVSADPDFGGPRRAANGFINLLLRQSALGEKQKGVLYRLLTEMYRRYGFDVGNPKSWSLDHDPRTWIKEGTRKRQPTLNDLSRLVWDKCVSLKVGFNGSATRKFEEVARLQKRLHGLRLKNARGDDVETQLAKAKADFLATVAEAVDKLDTGEELEELIAWDSFDVVKGLHERIVSLERSGIFKGRSPEFKPDCAVWRYDIKPLSRDEQQFFVDCLLSKLFYEAKARGEADGPDTAIVIDEASIFVDKDEDHIINILFREARKFGVMVILAAQEIGSFPQAVLSSSATKVILGVDDIYHRSTEDRLGLERGKLKYIRPQQTAFIQCKRRAGDDPLGQGFYEVRLAGSRAGGV